MIVHDSILHDSYVEYQNSDCMICSWLVTEQPLNAHQNSVEGTFLIFLAARAGNKCAYSP